MTCSGCGSWCALSDNYCRRCGEKLQMILPAAPPQRALMSLPVAVPPAVVKGVVAVVAGKALEWAVRRAVRSLSSSSVGAVKQALAPKTPQKAVPASAVQAALPVAGAVVTEMVVLWRQVRAADDGSTPPPTRR